MRIFLRFGEAGLKVVTNGSISFVCFVLLRREAFLSVNLIQSVFHERALKVSLVQSLVCFVQRFLSLSKG